MKFSNYRNQFSVYLAALVLVIFTGLASAQYEEEDQISAGAGPEAEVNLLSGDLAGADASSDFVEKTKKWGEEITTFRKGYENLKKKKGEVVSVEVYVKGEARELDFEKDHEDMLDRLNVVGDLLGQFQGLHDEVSSTLTSIEAVDTENMTISNPAILAEFATNKAAAESLLNLIRADLNELRSYKTRVNNTLIEEVHRYNLKISFRSRVAMVWMAAFVIVVIALAYLLKEKILVIPSGSTMQFTAVILIIFVIILFGVTDVMGENGVTGIMAAIAGYILGKSNGGDESNANMAEVIRAAQGLPASPPPAKDNDEEGR